MLATGNSKNGGRARWVRAAPAGLSTRPRPCGQGAYPLPASRAVGKLVSTKQVVHGGRVSPSVGNCRTRRAVHKAQSLWAGQLSIRASCKPRRGAAVWLFRGGACDSGVFTVKTQFSKVKTEPLPARGVLGGLAVFLVHQGGVFTVKTQFSKVKTEPLPARGVLGGLAVLLVDQGGVFTVKTQFSKVKTEPPPARGVLGVCPCQRCQGITAMNPARLGSWVQSRTVEAAASLKGKAMKAKLLRLAALSAPLLAAQSARAADPATALEAVQTLTTSSAGFGPVMFGLAIASVGIGIGVKWIKRSRGAA